MGVTLTQAMKELQKLQELHERRPGGKREFTEVEFVRAIVFTLSSAAQGLLSGAKLRAAKKMCFLLTGSPEIGPEWGPPVIEPYKTIEAGKPNQVAVAPVVDSHVLYLDDNGKAPAALPARRRGKDQSSGKCGRKFGRPSNARQSRSCHVDVLSGYWVGVTKTSRPERVGPSIRGPGMKYRPDMKNFNIKGSRLALKSDRNHAASQYQMRDRQGAHRSIKGCACRK